MTLKLSFQNPHSIVHYSTTQGWMAPQSFSLTDQPIAQQPFPSVSYFAFSFPSSPSKVLLLP